MLFDIRTSPSDIQLFREEPALWLLKHHPDYQYRTGGSAATLRGHAVEHAIRTACRWEMPAPDAIRHGQRLFLRNKPADLQGEEHLPYDKEFAALDDYIWEAYEFLQKHEFIKRYHTYQHKCENVIEGIKVLGYTDFMFADEDGQLVGFDLKTTARLPSAMRDTHVEQMAFYEITTGVRFSCLYVTPKKHAVYTITDETLLWGVARMQQTLKAMRIAVSLPSWEDLFTLFPPRDLSSFRWDEGARSHASNIWRY